MNDYHLLIGQLHDLVDAVLGVEVLLPVLSARDILHLAHQDGHEQLGVLREQLEERGVVLLEHLQELGQDRRVRLGLLCEGLEGGGGNELLDLLELLFGDLDLLRAALRLSGLDGVGSLRVISLRLLG